MSLFSPVKTGLHIGKDYLSFAILKPSGRTLQIVYSIHILLTKNSVRHSPIDQNILNVEEIEEHLKKIHSDFPKIRAISLSLPDLSARMILIEVRNRIPPLNELNQMIKWNMEQKFILKIGDSRFSHQLISHSRHGQTKDGRENGSKKYFSLLGIAILKNILAEYENLPISFHLVPKMINNVSLNLFNFYHDFLFKTASAGNFLFLSVLDNYFTLMVYEKGILQYIRTVGLRLAENGVESAQEEAGENNRQKIINHIESVLPYHFLNPQSKSEIQVFITGLSDLPKEILEFGDHYQLKVLLLRPAMVTSLEGVGKISDREMNKLLPAIAAAAGALN